MLMKDEKEWVSKQWHSVAINLSEDNIRLLGMSVISLDLVFCFCLKYCNHTNTPVITLQRENKYCQTFKKVLCFPKVITNIPPCQVLRKIACFVLGKVSLHFFVVFGARATLLQYRSGQLNGDSGMHDWITHGCKVPHWFQGIYVGIGGNNFWWLWCSVASWPPCGDLGGC